MTKQIDTHEKLGDIIREMNKRHQAFLIAIAKDADTKASTK